jgi:SNF2 family DNA or RNA helicase
VTISGPPRNGIPDDDDDGLVLDPAVDEGGHDDDVADDDALPEIPSGIDAPKELPPLPQTPATLAIARMSERSISRTVGMNAYQKGRGYARRGNVIESNIDAWNANGRVHGRAAEPYDVRLEITESGGFTSACTCPAWRGPERHCKHVAALLVSLRDRMRPLREAALHAAQQTREEERTAAAKKPRGRARGHRDEPSVPREVVVVDRAGPRVVSAGPTTLTSPPVSASSSVAPIELRAGWQVWLPSSDARRAPDFEYRVQLRSMAIAVTAYSAESRSPLAPEAAIESLGAFASPHRPILRALARAVRGGRATAVELRGEDAAEVLSMIRDRRVLIEPTLMEMRFVDDPLSPKIDLELNGAALRVKIAFERRSDGRRYSGAQGLWFEGQPGWHIDTVQGIARTLSESVTPTWLERLSRAPAISHPVEDLGRLLSEVLPRTALGLGTELPDISSVVELIDATPQFVLRAQGDITRVRAWLKATYGETELDVPPASLPSPLAVLPTAEGAVRPRVIRRDIGAEREAADTLFNLGLGLPADDRQDGWFEATGDKAIAFWSEGVGSLPEDWDRYIPDDLVDVTLRTTPVTPRARVSSGVDWLSLDVEFDSEGSKVNEADLRRALTEGRRLVRLEDGTWAPISPEQVSEVLLHMAELFAQGRKQLPLSQAGRIQELLRLVPGAKVEPETKELLHSLAAHKAVLQVPVPEALKATLRPYQHEGFSWLAFMHKSKTGAVLADDMGLGKTLQTIALLLWAKEGGRELSPEAPAEKVEAAPEPRPLKVKKKKADDEVAPKKVTKKVVKKAAEPEAPAPVAEKPAKAEKAEKSRGPTLVVAPTSVVHNWLREIERFAPTLRAVAWTGPDREKRTHELEHADLVITSYALLRRDEDFLQKYEFAYVILDEAQNIKNPMSATARAAKKLRSERRLALTGTPIENRLSEIWSIFDFLSPGMLGDLATFEERYARPIDRGDHSATRKLRGTIHPLVMRRTKSEVAKDLPERIVVERECELVTTQRALYAQVLQQVRASVFGEIDRVGVSKSQIQILAGLTRLRQAACDPRLLKLPGQKFGDEDSGKLDALMEILSEATQSGHRTLVFSQFVEMLTLIRAALEREGLKYEYLDGSTKDRMERVDHFNRDEAVPVFLISLKAGGSGLNLTGADTVVHFDPWWNPAVEDQATDRAHRIGQTRVVTAYRLIARGTIEEKIMALSAKKRELVSNVLGAEEAAIPKGLTRSDVELLFAEEDPAVEA